MIGNKKGIHEKGKGNMQGWLGINGKGIDKKGEGKGDWRPSREALGAFVGDFRGLCGRLLSSGSRGNKLVGENSELTQNCEP